MVKNTGVRKVKSLVLDVDWENRIAVIVDSREFVGLAKVNAVIE